MGGGAGQRILRPPCKVDIQGQNICQYNSLWSTPNWVLVIKSVTFHCKLTRKCSLKLYK